MGESCDWGVKLSKLSEMPDMVSFSCKNDLMDEQFSVQELYLGGTPEYDAHDRVTFMMNYNYTGSNSNLFTVIKFFNKEEGVKFRLGKEHGMWHFDPHDGRPITGSSNLPHGWTTSDFTGFRIKVKAGKRDLAYCNVLMDVAHHEDEHAHDHHEDEHAHDHHEDEHTDEHPPEYPPM